LIQTIEAGIDIKFLKNRLGLNVVYFDEVADKIPVNVQLSGVSGFSSTSVNAAKVERQGIEIVLNGRLVSNKNFTWDMSTNFSYLIKNPVSQIIDGQDQILLEGGAFGTRMARAFQVKGKDWGQLIGGGMKRNADGIPLVNPATGQYIRDEFRNWGSIVPKVNGGFLSNIAYKQFTFGFSLDYQVGGKFFSLSEMWGHFSGLMAKTAALNDKGVNVRTAVADGGGVKVTGVSSVDQKTPVDVYVDAQTYFHNFYFDQIAEPYVHSLSYVKLRDVSIGYNIPVKKIGNLGKYFQGAHFSLVARNAWLIWSDAKNFDPSEISNTYGEDGNFPGTRGIGFNLKLSF
jgi:outer membrane receptor protein involved in Fe transport